MKKFVRHEGIAAPIIRNNIDTDAIIPSVEMKHVSRKGLSSGLFAGWRYSERIQRIPDPEFILNKEGYEGATILLAGQNFGCGSSREHAVWALAEFGIRAIIASSFGSIFRTNCIANGLLPITLPTEIIAQLARHVEKDARTNRLRIDLEKRVVEAGKDLAFSFEIADSDAEMLLNGWDPIALTLQLDDRIEAFQNSDRIKRPWVYL